MAGLALVLFFAVPLGVSLAGCSKGSTAPQYCYSGDSGLQIGQLATLSLNSTLAIEGESLNYGQIGQSLNVVGYDCKGNTVSVSNPVYATSDMTIADINPATGQVCGGTWNRNTGGGVANYTTCTPPAATTKYLAYVTATAGGVTSNVVPVYVHPTVTSIVFGKSPSGSCSTDPDTTCCPASPNSVVTAPYYDGSKCISQNSTAQIAARVYANNDMLPADNITCKSGHITFGTQGASGVVTFDPNGVGTAELPGSVSVTAELSSGLASSASTIGFFSTCPPANITLAAVGQGTSSSVNVGLNNTQSFTATVTDTNGNPLTGVPLTFESSTPQTIPAGSTTGAVTPAYPGSAVITAVCEPPTCNPAPFSQLGYLGNGKPVTSNGIQVNTTGTSTTAIYVASTQSQYIYPEDFSTGQPGALLKLPYVPNSMVITQDGSTVYFGSSQGLMSLSTASNSVSVVSMGIQGIVLSVSPDGSTVVVTDPVKQTISLTSGSSVGSTFGGVATHAQWSPDSQTVYITTDPTKSNGNLLVTHSNYTNWQSTPIAGTGSADASYNDVTVMVPAIGAYFAGTPATDGRSYCATTTVTTATTPPTTSNVFTPLSDEKAVPSDRIAATADGLHILGASATAGMSDIYLVTAPRACTTLTGPAAFATTVNTPIPFPTVGAVPATITGVDPSTNSALAFVTYTGTGGKLPYYVPTAAGPTGSLKSLTLTGTPTAPVTGVFSTDNFTFFVGTSGDNLVHLITITYPATGAPTVTDSQQIAPQLPDANGNIVTPNLIVQRPRRVTS